MYRCGSAKVNRVHIVDSHAVREFEGHVQSLCGVVMAQDDYTELWVMSEVHANCPDCLGMNWWNSVTEVERARWLAVAGSATPNDAWEAFKRTPRGC